MYHKDISGVPNFISNEISEKNSKYCILIPIINEGDRIIKELERAHNFGVNKNCDIIICDGGSTDGCTELGRLADLDVNTLLIKDDVGKQGAQLRMGFWWALKRGYTGFITIDGNNKDSIEDVYKFVEALDLGYDFVQGSRFIKGGKAINTPMIRYLSVRLIHAPIISITARHWYTDTTNAYRAYSKNYIANERIKIFRDEFLSYELLAYLSVKAGQLGLKSCEVPVAREYPKTGKIPTKIKPIKGSIELFLILIKNLLGKYN